jgi:hypothetical protein
MSSVLALVPVYCSYGVCGMDAGAIGTTNAGFPGSEI